MSQYMVEAFQELDLLDDETPKKKFNLKNKEDIKDLDKALEVVDDTSDIEMIVDINAEDEESLRDTYVGSLLLYCPTCHTIHYEDEENVEVSEEDPKFVNVGQPCPHCQQVEGFEIKGKVAPYEENGDEEIDLDDLDDLDDNVEQETKETEQETNENLKESVRAKNQKMIREAFTYTKESEDIDTDLEDPKGNLDAQVGRALRKTFKLAPKNEAIVEGKKDCEGKECKVEEKKGCKGKECNKPLKEEVQDEAYEIAEYVYDKIKDKDTITMDEFEEQVALAIRELYGIDNVYENVDEQGKVEINGKTFDIDELLEGDIRGILSYKGWATNFSNGDLTTKEIEETLKGSKSLKESAYDVYADILERAKLAVNDGYDVDEAIWDAIDNGLIYTRDQFEILQSIFGIDELYTKDGENVGTYIDEQVYNEIYGEVEDYYNEKHENDGEEEVEESLKKEHRTLEQIKESVSAKLQKVLKEAPVYGLEPQYDSRKSFYGKAQVNTGDKNDKNQLYSYGTLVAEIKDGKPVVYGTYSQTTLRHIKDWLKQNGFKAENSKQIMNDYGVKNESINEDKSNEEVELDTDKLKEITSTIFTEIVDKLTTDDNKEEVQALVGKLQGDLNLTDEQMSEIGAPITDSEEPTQEPKEVKVEDEVVDVDDFDEIDETLFENLVNKYCTRVYENVKDFKLTNSNCENDKLILEGTINYKSGKSKETKFILEKLETKGNSIKFKGLNETFSTAKKPFTLGCKVENKKLLSENLTYNYKVKVNNESKQVYGRVENKH